MNQTMYLSEESQGNECTSTTKNFVSDPDIFMDMSKYFEYQYSPERIDKYWETRKNPKIEKTFLFC